MTKTIKTIIMISVLAMLFFGAIPVVGAVCECHNVGVIASVEPERLHYGLRNMADGVTFHVNIYNSGTFVEEGISLKIVEQRTGKVLYYNSEQVFLLPKNEDAKFDIIVPIDQLSVFDCGLVGRGGWETETYIVTAYQNAYAYDCWKFDNYENLYIKVKPPCQHT